MIDVCYGCLIRGHAGRERKVKALGRQEIPDCFKGDSWGSERQPDQ